VQPRLVEVVRQGEVHTHKSTRVDEAINYRATSERTTVRSTVSLSFQLLIWCIPRPYLQAPHARAELPTRRAFEWWLYARLVRSFVLLCVSREHKLTPVLPATPKTYRAHKKLRVANKGIDKGMLRFSSTSHGIGLLRSHGRS